MKSYNMQALRGLDYDDAEFQADMKDGDVYIPDEYLYKPSLGPYVIDKMYEKNINGLVNEVDPSTGVNFTQEAAQKIASEGRQNAREIYNELLRMQK